MNELVTIALRKPYTFVVLSILIVILGVQAVQKTPTDVFPLIEVPVTAVVWDYDGMLPKEYAGRITSIFERFLTSTVEGLKYIESDSYFGFGIINIFLEEGVSHARAEADIAAISQTVVNILPPDISPPMIMKLSPSSVPVVTLKVTSTSLTPAQLYNLSKMRIRPLLVAVEGTILPHPYGGQNMQVLINIDREALAARHMTPLDVLEALDEQNLIRPGGAMKTGSTAWLVLTNASVLNVEDFNSIPIKMENNAYVYLRDVADINLKGRVQQNSVLVDGYQAIMIVVMKSSEASTLEVVEGVKEMIPRIERIVPKDVEITVVKDASAFVEAAVESVVHEIVIASALVGLIVLLLLGSWRPTLIITTTIPLSILVSLITLHATGETLNIMTLGGLALSVGVLVDNATVVIENIDTHIEMGKPLESAIIDGSNQIVLPTFVSTLAIAIAWMPLFQLSGVAGFLFKPMALAIIFAMLASFILSYTLLPTMAKYLLHDPNDPGAHPHPDHPEIDRSAQEVYELTQRESEEEASHNIGGTHFGVPVPEEEYGEPVAKKSRNPFTRFQQGFERAFNGSRDRYGALLERAVERRGFTVIVMLAMALASLVLFYFNGRIFFPEIKGGTIQMHMRAPMGTRLEVTNRIVSLVTKDIEQRLLPGKVEGIISNCGLPVGPHNLAFIPTPTLGSQDCDLTITLKNKQSPVWEQRKILRKGLSKRYPGTQFTFQPANLTTKILNFGSPAPIDVQVNGPKEYKNYAHARQLAARFRKIPGARDVVIQQNMRMPTLLVEADRRRALNVGVSQKEFSDTLLVTVAGSYQVDQQFWLLRENGMAYPINIRVPQQKLTNLGQLRTVPVKVYEDAQGELVNRLQSLQLFGNISEISAVGTPGVVTHGDLMPLFDIYINPEGRDLGSVLADVRQVVHEMEDKAPRSAEVVVTGQAEIMESAYAELLVGLAGAIVLIYLLIVVNFQSWIDPFIIITGLPGALAGIAWILFLTHTNISVPALTGAIMTMGTATANSILVVAYARERIEMHGEALRAAIEAGIARFRPVLMTAAAMIMGMVPMALSNTQNAPLGRAVIGGLLVATIFTLLFVPCVYGIIYHRRTVAQPESSS